MRVYEMVSQVVDSDCVVSNRINIRKLIDFFGLTIYN